MCVNLTLICLMKHLARFNGITSMFQVFKYHKLSLVESHSHSCWEKTHIVCFSGLSNLPVLLQAYAKEQVECFSGKSTGKGVDDDSLLLSLVLALSVLVCKCSKMS